MHKLDQAPTCKSRAFAEGGASRVVVFGSSKLDNDRILSTPNTWDIDLDQISSSTSLFLFLESISSTAHTGALRARRGLGDSIYTLFLSFLLQRLYPRE